MNYNLLKVFIKVAEFGSFTKAAHQLKQPKSRVSRSILRLEEELNTELIKRSTRSISLTEAGKNLYQDTHLLMEQLDKKIDSFSDESDLVSGTISISAPISFGENILPQLICEFNKIYPQINFRVMLSDTYVDLAANDIDLALRAGKIKDSSLKQKKLADTQLILVASPDYLKLKGEPKSWEDIKDHTILSFNNENKQDPLSEIYQQYGFSPFMRANSFPMLKQLALAGTGIVIIPSTNCNKELKNGTLKKVLPKWWQEKNPLHVVFSPSKNLPLKTRAFIDFLVENKDVFS